MWKYVLTSVETESAPTVTRMRDLLLRRHSETLPDVAWCGQAWVLAAARVAGRGLARPYACGRWLPVWLPGISLATLMFRPIDTLDSSITCVPRSTDRGSGIPVMRLGCYHC